MIKNKRKNRIYKRRLFIIALIIFILFSIINKLFFSSKKNLNHNEETILVIEDEIQKLKNRVIVDSLKNIYASYDDIKDIYDENIFFDEVNNKVITTYNKHIAILELEKNQIEINDAQTSIKGKLQYIENTLYLPISDLGLVYDFEYSYSDESNIVILESISKNKSVGTVLKNVKLKKVDKTFPRNFVRLSKDDKVTIIDEENKYYKVRSDYGIIGNISKKKIGNIEEIRESMVNSKIKDVNILSKYSEVKGDYDNLSLEKNKYYAVTPELFSLQDNKNVELKVSVKSDSYIKYFDWITENNINLWATITNNAEVSEVMLTYDDRKDIINKIYIALIENNYKVLNINFEKINDINSFYRFLIEITPRLREAGIKTVVTYNSTINEEKVSKIVDYIVKEEK